MLTFNFFVPFIFTLAVLLATIFLLRRKEIENKFLKSTLIDQGHDFSNLKVQIISLKSEHKAEVLNTNNTWAKQQQQLRNKLVEQEQLVEDLQKTLTALRKHKQNQRNNRRNTGAKPFPVPPKSNI